MGSMYSSVLDLGDDGVDHWSECFGETWRNSRKRDAKTASTEGDEDDDGDDDGR
jgi:hypothetical protein